MRVFASALLAVLATGPGVSAQNGLAVTLAAHPVTRSCDVASTATIVAYDANVPHDVAYRFVRSDGSTSPVGRVSFAGDGAVAQSVRDTWTPRGKAPWVALEIVAPERVRSQHLRVTSHCPASVVAATH
jgi:hypothetical protein